MRSVDPSTRIRIIVLGYVVRGPLGGLAWHHLHYVAGLAALGHDVWFLEDSDDYPSCYNPILDRTGTDAGYALDFARRAFERIDMAERWAYYDARKQAWLGPDKAQVGNRGPGIRGRAKGSVNGGVPENKVSLLEDGQRQVPRPP